MPDCRINYRWHRAEIGLKLIETVKCGRSLIEIVIWVSIELIISASNDGCRLLMRIIIVWMGAI